MDEIQRFGETLHFQRRRKGLTMRELAKRTGVSYTIISLLERGKRPGVSFDVIVRLARALDMSIDDAICGLGFAEEDVCTGKEDIDEMEPAALEPAGT